MLGFFHVRLTIVLISHKTYSLISTTTFEKNHGVTDICKNDLSGYRKFDSINGF